MRTHTPQPALHRTQKPVVTCDRPTQKAPVPRVWNRHFKEEGAELALGFSAGGRSPTRTRLCTDGSVILRPIAPVSGQDCCSLH